MPIFGPVYSRRFGMSLGVDVVKGTARECNFDCLYCELKATPKTAQIISKEDPQDLIDSVKKTIDSGIKIDVITITANGEPTIYDRLDELIDGLNRIKTVQKTLLLSNGSTICNNNIQKTLKKFDVVKLSLDSARDESFKKLDRPIDFDLPHIMECMSNFRKIYHGELILETLLVENINDSDEDIEALRLAYIKISPDRIDLSTIDRPPAFAVKPISAEKLWNIAEKLGLPNISIALRKDTTPLGRTYSAREWRNTLTRRPLTINDAKFLADTKSLEIFEDMISRGELIKKTVANMEFYSLK